MINPKKVVAEQAQRHRGHFEAVPPKSLLVPPKREMCPPSEKCAPQARIDSQKKVTGPITLECISGPVPPQNTAGAPPKREKSLVSERKARVNAKTKLMIPRRRPSFGLTSDFVGKNRNPHHKISSRPARIQTYPPPPPPSKNCAQKGSKRPVYLRCNLG